MWNEGLHRRAGDFECHDRRAGLSDIRLRAKLDVTKERLLSALGLPGCAVVLERLLRELTTSKRCLSAMSSMELPESVPFRLAMNCSPVLKAGPPFWREVGAAGSRGQWLGRMVWERRRRPALGGAAAVHDAASAWSASTNSARALIPAVVRDDVNVNVAELVRWADEPRPCLCEAAETEDFECAADEDAERAGEFSVQSAGAARVES